jgi:hypothetical protein
LVTGKSAAKLLGFGLSKRITESDTDATKTIEATVMRTAAYMAPEQLAPWLPVYVTVGGVVSILTAAVLVEPRAAPVLLAPSVAVQLML